MQTGDISPPTSRIIIIPAFVASMEKVGCADDSYFRPFAMPKAFIPCCMPTKPVEYSIAPMEMIADNAL